MVPNGALLHKLIWNICKLDNHAGFFKVSIIHRSCITIVPVLFFITIPLGTCKKAYRPYEAGSHYLHNHFAS